MKRLLLKLVLALALMGFAGATPWAAEDGHLNIVRFQIEGSTMLPEAKVQGAVALLVRLKRVFADMRKVLELVDALEAVEALEAAAVESVEGIYRRAGSGTVRVLDAVPPNTKERGDWRGHLIYEARGLTRAHLWIA